MKFIKHSQQSKIKSINQQPLPTTNPFDIFRLASLFSQFDDTLQYVLFEGRLNFTVLLCRLAYICFLHLINNNKGKKMNFIHF